ncbi:hypothetical protein Q5427_10995 [Brochothrix thermosphacta]|uniref:hypothetical protein n=1 Tax=Brochothrix thermosphacta TaxID=2756 RepID=UPI002713C5B5|nr:hypothetical protein [Brochothrix thermosphacta]MDO7864815.1 hypothetical protein [Brochothrix thermosphacta]
MIYEGKEYKMIPQEGAAIGDLIHVSEVDGTPCDVWCFATDACIDIPDIDVVLSNGYECLDCNDDVFTRYRYVKDVKETLSTTEDLAQKVESNATTLSKATHDKLNEVAKGEDTTKKRTIFAVVEYSFSHQGLVNKKEVDRHGTLSRAIAVSEGLNERNCKGFYSIEEILV